VTALCIVHLIHHSRPACPFGKGAARDVDGGLTGQSGLADSEKR